MIDNGVFNIDNLWERPGFLIRRLNQIHYAIFFEALEGKLTPLQYGVLTILNTGMYFTQTQIGSEIGADRTTLATTIELLEKKGMLKKEVSFSDRRKKMIQITAKGRKLLQSTQQKMHEAQLKLLEPLTFEQNKEFLTLITILVKANNHLGGVKIRHFRQE